MSRRPGGDPRKGAVAGQGRRFGRNVARWVTGNDNVSPRGRCVEGHSPARRPDHYGGCDGTGAWIPQLTCPRNASPGASSVALRSRPMTLAHNAPISDAHHAQPHSALVVGTPKVPGEPPRVQPSKKVESHWDEHGNRIAD